MSLEFWIRQLTNDSSTYGRVICQVTKSTDYHVETRIVYPDNAAPVFYSAMIGIGVRFVSEVEHEDSPEGEYWVRLTLPEEVTDRVMSDCYSRIGRGYDFFGAFNSGLPSDLQVKDGQGYPLHDANKDFCSLCSEEVAAGVGIVGLYPLPCPSVFRRDIEKHLGIVRAAVIPMLTFTDEDFQYIQNLVDAAHNPLDPAMAEKVVAACAR